MEGKRKEEKATDKVDRDNMLIIGDILTAFLNA